MKINLKPYRSTLVSTTAPRYHLSPDDRICMDGREWRAIYTNAVGHNFRPVDGSSVAQQITHEDFHVRLERGTIEVDIGYFSPDRARARLSEEDNLLVALSKTARHRLLQREAWASKFLDFERSGRAVRTQASISNVIPEMTAELVADAVRNNPDRKRRNTRQKLDFNTPPCAKSILRWTKDYEFGGLAALQDDCETSGNRFSRFLPDEVSILAEVVRTYADISKPTKGKIVDDVKTRFDDENSRREMAGLARLRVPGRDAVYRAIGELDPFETDVARLGVEKALQKHHPVGIGLVIELPLQRVEMDEWKTDLMAFLAKIGFLAKLTPEMREEIRKGRWYLTAAIDVATRCIIALRLSRTVSAETAIAALEMITLDKKQWSDAVGALSPWLMHGTPVEIATDNGPAFKSAAFRLAANAIRAELVRPVAGAPQLRAYIERVFRTIATKLMHRLTAYTFSDIVEKGEYDPGANAVHDADTLAFALIRWVVDIYHNTKHPGLGGETPLQAWQRLERTHGTPPPPSLRRRRLAFGTVFERTVTNSGVRVLGVDYTCEELQRWRLHEAQRAATPRKVEVRWLPSDIGGVLVKLGKQFVNVPATHEEFQGVTATELLAAGRDMRARIKANEEIAAPIVFAALRAIREIDEHARARADIVVEDWSPERLERLERKLFTGFRISPPQDPIADGGAQDLLAGAVPAGGAADMAPAVAKPVTKPAALGGARKAVTRKPKSAPRQPIKPTRLS